MAHSSGRVGTNEVKERFDSPDFRDSQGDYAYHVGQESGAYFLEFTQQRANSAADPVIQGRRKLDYFVGSGAAARSYLMSVDGFLYSRRPHTTAIRLHGSPRPDMPRQASRI